MSDTFDRFMRQYQAQGQEKADGYDESHFSGLTDEEKARVFELLSREAEAVPETATRWLFRLDPGRAESVTRAQIQQKSGDPDAENYVRQLALLKHTGDLKYQQAMIDEYPQNSDWYKEQAVWCIVMTPRSDVVREFLRRVVLTETDAEAVAMAAVHLLLTHKVPRSASQEAAQFQDWLARLKSPSLTTRLDAVKEMEARYPFTA